MARKETIYTVNKETNLIERASRTYQSALKFAATLPYDSYYVCTSEFQNLKKGQPISNITALLNWPAQEERAMKINSESPAPYSAEKFDDDSIIEQAIKLIQSKLKTPGMALTSPKLVREFLILQLAQFEEEHFSMILLDNQHKVIGFENIFRGTIDGASVYPREVVKTVLAHNAAAVILAHNHPSGNPEPSQADIAITRRLKESLALIDVRILDHVIVGGCSQTLTTSFALRGLI